MSEQKRKISYLSGVTFLNLLLGAKRETVDNYKIFGELARIYNDWDTIDFSGASATQQTGHYRSGRGRAPVFMNFYDSKSISDFEARIINNRNKVLNQINGFISDNLYIEMDDPWVIKALFDVISNDNNLDSSAVLFMDTADNEIRQDDLKTCSEVYVPEVLLGIWLYTIKHKDDKELNAKAYVDWMERARDNTMNIKKELFSWDHPLIVKPYESVEDEEDTDRVIDKESIEGTQADSDIIPLVEDEDDEKPSFEGTVFVSPQDKMVDLGRYKPEDILIARGGAVTKLTPFGIYMANIQKKHESVYNFLFKTMRPLESFYVCNDLEMQRSSLLPLDELESYIRISDVEIDKLPIKSCRYVHIMAEGGMGKSMVMHHLTLSAIKKYNTFKRIPIFVTARLFSKFSGDFMDLLCSEFQRHNPEFTMVELINLLSNGQALLLIDGLDEIASDRAEAFFDGLEKFIDQYDDVYIIVSARRHLYARVLLTKFTQYELSRLSFDQAKRVVRKIGDSALHEGVTEEFIGDLENKRSGLDWEKQYKFLGNPLLLCIMLLTYSENHIISSKRYKFYADAYDALASKHDATKNYTRDFKCGLDSDDFQLLFGEFCALAFSENTYDFTEEDFRECLKTVINLNGLKISVDSVVSDVTEKLCLMFKDSDGYHFIHNTFMEYFAAYFFSKQDSIHFKPIYKIFITRDGDRHDDETLSMLYGMAYKQVELHIILPFLKDLIETRYNYAVTSKYQAPKDTYNEFLDRIYPCLYFAYGEYNCQNYMERSASEIYNFIKDIYNIGHLEMFEMTKELSQCTVMHTFYRIPENWQDPDDPGETHLVQEYDIDPEFFEMYPGETPAGAVFEVSLLELSADIEDSRELLKTIHSEDFILYKEYREIVKLYHRLQDKYSEERQSNNNFFSQFH